MNSIPLDAIEIHLYPGGLMAINAILALVMFGVALDLKLSDFRRVFVASDRRGFHINKGPIIGLVAQFFLLPAIACALGMLLDVRPSIALGMIIVASCPGGNVSNFMTHLARGNTALSISMTAISSAAALFMTPLNISLWGHVNPATRSLLRSVSLQPHDMITTIMLLLGIPLLLGMVVGVRYPAFARRAQRPFKIVSIIALGVFVVMALLANLNVFLHYVKHVLGVVFVLNGVAYLFGYGISRLFGLSVADRRAVSIEVGIHNSSLGLVLILNFFGGLGGMALVAAWWSIWHLISGLALAGFWSQFPTRLAEPPTGLEPPTHRLESLE